MSRIKAVRRTDSRLSAAVVATPADLQKDASVECRHRFEKLFFRMDNAEWADGKAVLCEPRFLQSLVLNNADRFDAGAQGRKLCNFRESFNAYLLNFERDGICA